ncbi:MAG: aminomethyl-transferring glycine dehydrogenase [Bdellovibrionota bacterium]|nr:MAG: aminomethyl-transferring glycine dehydrogenase [Bdellovibrionota bacterium]
MSHTVSAEHGTVSSEVKVVQGRSEASPFVARHIGPREADVDAMLKTLSQRSLESFMDSVVPKAIRSKSATTLRHYDAGLTEAEALGRLRAIANKNQLWRSYLGLGYYDCITPPVIQRNILENPGWYTQYTPYQPEISQGRLEALLNYQTMICELTGLAVSNASLLDEGTAAAEAMTMSLAIYSKNAAADGTPRYFVSNGCHPQTISIVATRAKALGIEVIVGDASKTKLDQGFFGVLLQYPDTNGALTDVRALVGAAHASGAVVTLACDLLALTLLTPPGELGADIAVGSAQRFGVPLGFGGPHAAFFATKDEHKRLMPGRLVGVSIDAKGRPALRLSLQTREQHIRREKATSNICTAQVLLAIMASMYAVYHGPEGLRSIAVRVHTLACRLAKALAEAGYALLSEHFFDTVHVRGDAAKVAEVKKRCAAAKINLRFIGDAEIAISLDEATSDEQFAVLLQVFGAKDSGAESAIPEGMERRSDFLSHPVFHRYHSETEFLRYLRRLESKDLSLGTAMIPLGSCTMKLNATSEMLPVTWAEFGAIHPFVPSDQVRGYHELFSELEAALQDITGYSAISLQPNAGSQGEYAGLLAIREYFLSRGEANRNICLIPRSAHGTNPASAVMAGFKVVVVECDSMGNVDLEDLRAKANEYRAALGCVMVTYPSTHGVFEEGIRAICDIIHEHGGQVYMDGANLNALVGYCKPAELGVDVGHINLHKTFCIPHGGGGPGMGPIGVREHLAPFLPGHPIVDLGHKGRVGAVSAAPWGSASILTISWMYIAMMGSRGLSRATALAILNANYVAKRLQEAYPTLYRGGSGFVAHECIIDLRDLKRRAGIEVDDVAKRLMDYGFHAPTVSWPVAGTMMVEPTESESKEELDRFCDAMLQIFDEVQAIERGEMDRTNNPLKNAPHTALDVVASEWNRPYSREQAAFPTGAQSFKFWPAVGCVDSSFGDKNLVCTCPPIDSYQ